MNPQVSTNEPSVASDVTTYPAGDPTLVSVQCSSLRRLLQLVSPNFPVGAFAYSQGLEAAVHRGWVHDEDSTVDWVSGLLSRIIVRQDLPVLKRCQAAAEKGDFDALARWSAFHCASREAGELQLEDRQTGRAMLRALRHLGAQLPEGLKPSASYLAGFALAAAHFGVPIYLSCVGYAHAWTENQVMAASRIIPLGQLQTQSALSRCLEPIETHIRTGLRLTDDEIGFAAPGYGMVCAEHETQYSRLFRS